MSGTTREQFTGPKAAEAYAGATNGDSELLEGAAHAHEEELRRIERVRHPSRATRAKKRAFDLTVASLLLLFAILPMAAIGLCIRLGSRGPVLYRSPRVGRNGEEFLMLKFRTMHDKSHHRRSELAQLNEAPEGGVFKISQDPRVTRIGAFLRAFSLDELPQLFQVVSGRLSVVGPRPLPPEEDRLIAAASRRRLDVRPGVTGPWQVAGSWRVPLPIMLELDLHYVDQHSLLTDVKLLGSTVAYVLRRRGV